MGKRKWIVTTVAVIIAIFLIYQIYAALHNSVSTETVTQYTAVDGVDITGIVIRDEEFIKHESGKALHFETVDAGRVSKNGIIADVYENEAQSIAASKVAELENEIKNIEEIQKYNNSAAVDINLLNAKIYDNLNKFIASASTGKYTDISENRDAVLTLMNRKQIATGQAVDFSSQLTALKNELNSVRATVGTPSGYIRAQKSGYFVSTVDGYENILNTDNLDNITPEFLDNLKPEEKPASVIGKLVSNYTWYIAANVSINDSLLFKTGDELVIRTSLKSNPEINVIVHKINISPSSDRAVIIFSCQEMSGELSSVRSCAMTVVRKVYSGLKVSSKALRMVNMDVEDKDGKVENKNVTGVYTVNELTAHFVPVNILYSKEGFAICEYDTKNGKLKLYDEIVVGGKNIYEGKIIN
ncbi:MAG: hypothetical protein KBS52_03285 [Clostridiales bacterium]|nr:hypothetical protein [Candidatus Equinaster intestinalis]